MAQSKFHQENTSAATEKQVVVDHTSCLTHMTLCPFCKMPGVTTNLLKEHLATKCSKKNEVGFSAKEGIAYKGVGGICNRSMLSLAQNRTLCSKADRSTHVPVYVDTDCECKLLNNQVWMENIRLKEQKMATETRQIFEKCHRVIHDVFSTISADLSCETLTLHHLKESICRQSVCPNLKPCINDLSSEAEVLKIVHQEFRWYYLVLLRNLLSCLYRGDNNKLTTLCSLLDSFDEDVNVYLKNRIFQNEQHVPLHMAETPLQIYCIPMDSEWENVPASHINLVCRRVKQLTGRAYAIWFCSIQKFSIYDYMTKFPPSQVCTEGQSNHREFVVGNVSCSRRGCMVSNHVTPPYKVLVPLGTNEPYIERPRIHQ